MSQGIEFTQGWTFWSEGLSRASIEEVMLLCAQYRAEYLYGVDPSTVTISDVEVKEQVSEGGGLDWLRCRVCMQFPNWEEADRLDRAGVIDHSKQPFLAEQ